MAEYISKDEVLHYLRYWKYLEPYEQIQNMNGFELPEACQNCSNNPKNGGSGICHCTLGTPKIT